MATAAVMLAHQVASKALRDAAFLAVWPTTALPLMVMAPSVPVVAVVPVFARLLERFGPRVVVPAGFLLSAVRARRRVAARRAASRGWRCSFIYTWPDSARCCSRGSGRSSASGSIREARAQSFGRIAAAGTVGGVLGGVAAAWIAMALPVDSVLLLLAALHVLCAVGVLWLGQAPVLLPGTDQAPSDRVFAFQALRESPHLRTIALMMVLAPPGAGVLDYLLKWRAADKMQTGAGLLRFFAVFYGAVQLASFAAQAGLRPRFSSGSASAGRCRRLPAGVGLSSAIALLFPVWQIIVLVRGIDAVLRNSLFRSGYELFFVPMDAAERRRMKTFIDVTCDRAGETLGALIVQVLLFTSVVFLTGELLGAVVLLAAGALWFGRRLDRLYLGVVEQQLVQTRRTDAGHPRDRDGVDDRRSAGAAAAGRNEVAQDGRDDRAAKGGSARCACSASCGRAIGRASRRRSTG